MGFFNSLMEKVSPSKKNLEIIAPVSGEILPIEKTPDEAFAQKIVGDGVAIDPRDGLILAPCDGKIGTIFRTNHAFSIRSLNGVEIFVHFGVDTLELKGDGFQRLVEQGTQVKAGTPILKIDLENIRGKVKSVLTPVVVSNVEDIGSIEYRSGRVEAGKDVVFTVKLK